MKQRKDACRVRERSQCWFFTAKNVEKPLLKKNLIMVRGGKPPEAVIAEQRGWRGDNCFFYAV